ncbi:alpha-hydroxy-acid oxidizing protein [Microlunatus speluncae]|uniref:alpha-hydroxy-acid oxidizing protein n=1 Tax=Microlunatus speluncae TaxID=2594267 RepID=UPI001FE81641|nr:alpha-hydroxy-acid oxidizing protein [Microlunatus speluncae]
MAPARLERRAGRAMSRTAAAYVLGGAGAEATMRANADAFDRIRLVPRMLRDVSDRDLGVTLFGRRLRLPFLLGPIGALEIVHPAADLAVARAAAAAEVPMIFSSQASVPLEDCAAAMGAAPRWFQLYWSASQELAASFVARAERAGCEAIVITLDTTMLGWRPRDLDLAFLPFARGQGIAQYTSDPVFRRLVEERLATPVEDESPRPTPAALRTLFDIARAHPGRLPANLRSPVPRAAVQTYLDVFSRPSLSWDDLGFLRDLTRLPILLKGILHPDDARRAVEAGMDGIVVSNHGGRQVDGAVATLDALPAIMAAVDDRIPVLLDSGVRTGADVIKAVALGAAAVLIGRPYVYGLALAGADGVREVIDNLAADLDLTLGLSGHRAVSELGPESITARPGSPAPASDA